MSLVKYGSLLLVTLFLLPANAKVELSSASGSTQMETGPATLVAASKKKRSKKKRNKKSRRKRSKRKVKKSRSELMQALQLVRKGKYVDASIELFKMSHSPKYRDRKMQIKYLLGLMLYQMKLNQVSAFQFISVVKQGNNKYLKQGLEKLSLAADHLGDDTLLNYAISKIRVQDFPKVHRDMLYYRIGEYQVRNKQNSEAARSLSKVRATSSFYGRAKYLQGLAYSELKKSSKALNAFDDLIDSRIGQPVNDEARVSGLIGKARVYYQGKRWDEAIEAYREIPRDTVAWHDTLFESSWAMLRNGRFRSALSNFQSLHSAYYEDFYLPESLLLRSIVYLYICKYEEMDKVLKLYNRTYKPVYKDINTFLKNNRSPIAYYEAVAEVLEDYAKEGDQIFNRSYKIPFIAARQVSREGDVKRTLKYIKELFAEKARIDALPSRFRSSQIGKYSSRVVDKRIKKAQGKAGRQIKSRLIGLKAELVDLSEQEGFIRYEMINGKKEMLKKKVAGKSLPEKQVDDNSSRDYYIQNGYEYYPFQGEYWLDELGNYHYVGVQSCN